MATKYPTYFTICSPFYSPCHQHYRSTLSHHQLPCESAAQISGSYQNCYVVCSPLFRSSNQHPECFSGYLMINWTVSGLCDCTLKQSMYILNMIKIYLKLHNDHVVICDRKRTKWITLQNTLNTEQIMYLGYLLYECSCLGLWMVSILQHARTNSWQDNLLTYLLFLDLHWGSLFVYLFGQTFF